MSETRGERLIRILASGITKTQGSDSLNRLAKLLVVGNMAKKGFADKRNSDLDELFKSSCVFCGHFNVLVRFSNLSEVGRFTWDFASGNVVGKSTGEDTYISSKGRHSKWVGEGAEKNWEAANITGLVLVGLDAEDNPRFYLLTRDQFLALDTDRVIIRPNEHPDWEAAWDGLQLEQNFSSMFGS